MANTDAIPALNTFISLPVVLHRAFLSDCPIPAAESDADGIHIFLTSAKINCIFTPSACIYIHERRTTGVSRVIDTIAREYMTRFCTISFEERLDFHEGSAASSIANKIRRHVAAGCTSCCDELQWMKDFMPVMGAAIACNNAKVSDWALRRSVNIMPDVEVQTQPGLIERLVSMATVVHDSRLCLSGQVAARDLSNASCHVVYQSNNVDIDVWQEPNHNGNWYLVGQALAKSGEPLSAPQSVMLVSSQRQSAVGMLDDSEFTFDSIRPGTYELRLSWNDNDIVVDGLTVGLSEVV